MRLFETLPKEIEDEILISSGDIELCIDVKNYYCAKKLYSKDIHTLNWTITRNLKVFKWFYENDIELVVRDILSTPTGNLNYDKWVFCQRDS